MKSFVRLILIVAITGTIVACGSREEAPPPPPDAIKVSGVIEKPKDLEQWLGTSPVLLGCYLEQNYDYRDEQFHCNQTEYVTPTDPDSDEFYDGPQVPPELAVRIHPSLKTLELNWEGGVLKTIQVQLTGNMQENKIRGMFPDDEQENMTTMDAQEEEPPVDTMKMGAVAPAHRGEKANQNDNACKEEFNCIILQHPK